eukprot:CAMPEP_0168564176 /NCGR_PEP_ID=MMETSP0413-20121227/13093_1 /TAXON_ID=136452 /ORGANISM="Filamoeba nolandi, Strain NC-AS-23-1" /LENGTH=83 /DNA_ID=CAMNT_0008595805 /DNA_START=85 /DNA_END=333 /DNA_ORIENTATION=+
MGTFFKALGIASIPVFAGLYLMSYTEGSNEKKQALQAMQDNKRRDPQQYKEIEEKNKQIMQQIFDSTKSDEAPWRIPPPKKSV